MIIMYLVSLILIVLLLLHIYYYIIIKNSSLNVIFIVYKLYINICLQSIFMKYISAKENEMNYWLTFKLF